MLFCPSQGFVDFLEYLFGVIPLSEDLGALHLPRMPERVNNFETPRT